jgi:hypothetical protein
MARREDVGRLCRPRREWPSDRLPVQPVERVRGHAGEGVDGRRGGAGSRSTSRSCRNCSVKRRCLDLVRDTRRRSGLPGPGVRNKASTLLDAIGDEDIQAIIEKVVERAKGGDVTCAELILDRVAPPPKSRVVEIGLAEVGRYDGDVAVLRSYGAIVRATAAGEISPAEALELAELVDKQRRAFADLARDRMNSEPTPEDIAQQKRAAERISEITRNW